MLVSWLSPGSAKANLSSLSPVMRRNSKLCQSDRTSYTMCAAVSEHFGLDKIVMIAIDPTY